MNGCRLQLSYICEFCSYLCAMFIAKDLFDNHHDHMPTQLFCSCCVSLGIAKLSSEQIEMS